MTESDLPAEAAEADVIEQRLEVAGDEPDPEPVGTPVPDRLTEADPADLAEQSREAGFDPEEYDGAGS
ncbi:MAG TPA: hypothetical protein VHO01_03490 [Jatrophihabitans sp.]|nr:hypothetical protein [Jatrophihabitans sp.]